MNPVLIILVILLAVALWFLLSFAFKPIGKLFYKIGKEAFDEINDEEVDENEKK